jgi:hypothetical protein
VVIKRSVAIGISGVTWSSREHYDDKQKKKRDFFFRFLMMTFYFMQIFVSAL